MDQTRLKTWLTTQIDQEAPERFSEIERFRCRASIHKLCELRKLALTGSMEGMAAGANMQVDEPAPFAARIDGLLDDWRSRYVAIEGDAAGQWTDELRGLIAPVQKVRTLRCDPARADALLRPEEVKQLDAFARWLRDPVEVARTFNAGADKPDNYEVFIGKPDLEGLRQVAELFEETFETMFPPELAALLSRVNGFDILGFADSQPAAADEVPADELSPESAVWSTAFDFESGIEQAEAYGLNAEDAFAWPLEGVNFHRFYFATGPLKPEGRPELTVWTTLQGQRKPDKVGTFWDWLKLRR